MMGNACTDDGGAFGWQGGGDEVNGHDDGC